MTTNNNSTIKPISLSPQHAPALTRAADDHSDNGTQNLPGPSAIHLKL